MKSIAEARKTLGLTEEEFNDYINYKNDKQFYEDIIRNFKMDEKMEGHDREQILENEFLGLWRRSLESGVKEALAARDKERKEEHTGVGDEFDMFDRFEEQTGVDADEVVQGAVQSGAVDPHDDYQQAVLSAYKEFIYE